MFILFLLVSCVVLLERYLSNVEALEKLIKTSFEIFHEDLGSKHEECYGSGEKLTRISDHSKPDDSGSEF